MAKKSTKKQPKQSNETSISDTATSQIITTPPVTSTVANQPISVTQTDTQAPTTTQHSFFDFITLATTEDIKKFLKLANTTPEGKNLENLWRRAHAEGYEKGRKVALKDLETESKDKFREGIAKGMDLGHEQGYNVAKGAFDEVVKVAKAKEALKPQTSTIDTGAQTDPPITLDSTQNGSTTSVSHQTRHILVPTTSTTTVGIQTNPTTFPITSEAQTFVENGVGTHLATTAAVSTQTNDFIVTAPLTTSIAIQTSPCKAIAIQTASSSLEKNSAKPTVVENANNASCIAHLARKIAPVALLPPHTSSFRVAHSSTYTENSVATTFPELIAQPSTPTALEKQSKIDSSIQIHQKTEISLTASQTTPSLVKNANNLSKGQYSGQSNHSDHPNLENASLDSTDMSHPPMTTRFEISAGFGDNIENSSPDAVSEVVAPAAIVSVLKTRPTTTSSAQNHPKSQKSPVFNQNCPKLHVSTRFNWADDANSLPIYSTPQQSQHPPPRDLSCLRSSSENPFSSLRRHHGQSRNPRQFTHSQHQYNRQRPFPTHHYHSSCPHALRHLSQPHIPTSLDWDRDPRLINLGIALRALSWARR